jgi:UDP-glucose 4-epimerase
MPLTEEFMSSHLSSPYQITKMVGELYCNFFVHHYNFPTVKGRFFKTYGPGEVPGQYRNVIPNFIYLAMQGQPPLITGTGRRSPGFHLRGRYRRRAPTARVL